MKWASLGAYGGGATAHRGGCGANDKLPTIYDFIATHGADLRRMATQLGVELDDATP